MKKALVVAAIMLCCRVSVFAQSNPVLFWGIGPEVGFNTDFNTLGGGVFSFDAALNDFFALGTKLALNYDLEKKWALQPAVSFRWFFSSIDDGKGRVRFFLEVEGGITLNQTGTTEKTSSLSLQPLGGGDIGLRYIFGKYPVMFSELYFWGGYPRYWSVGFLYGLAL